jgi:cell wall-associated NlpC family hydrolase
VGKKKKTYLAYASKGRRYKLILYARSLLGSRYRWGASGGGAFDCSGFTMVVFKKIGINLPHSTREQYKMGIPVSKNNLKVGDLVFFSTYRPGPSHVGIYIDGGNFIHASSSRRKGGVKISSLYESYYQRRYIGARRII